MEHYAHLAPESEVILFPDDPIIYAGFWERFAAAFIDGLILLIPNLFLKYVIPGPPGAILSILAAWLYAAIQESGSAQTTIGKKAMGIKVMSADGQRLSFGQASGRHFGKWISCIILLIGFFMMLWDDKRQTLHDKMADALVVKS